MKRPLSALARPEIIKDLESTTFDLLVIGGGITGAGIAWDAAKRGIKTALIEQNDFSWGTSSRSTKLIHGGLRYLKKGEVALVRQVGREREWLHRSAPHLVTPMPMLLPIYKGGTFGYWSAALGLFVYDRLAGVEKAERRAMHRAEETVRLEPLLNRKGLKGCGLYYEYRSDDARLTVEVLKTAVRHGAWAANYVEVTDFQYFQSKLCGVKAVDRLTGQEIEIKAKRIVNATGPWVDGVRSKDHSIKGKSLLLTKGVHLVVDHSRLPVRQAAYFDVPGGRMVFVIPRDGKTYIGTTDTIYSGDPSKMRTTEADRDYLLQAIENIFPFTALKPEDVESMWAGLRPLIRSEGKSPSDISRRDEIWESTSGLITIAGGKLTGFRKMAEKVVDLLSRSLERESRQAYGPCTTAKETLSGGDSGRCETYGELREQLLLLGIKKGLTLNTVDYLLKLYGSNTSEIFMRLDGLENRFEEKVSDEEFDVEVGAAEAERDIEEWQPGIVEDSQEPTLAEAWRRLEEIASRAMAADRQDALPSSGELEGLSKLEQPYDVDEMIEEADEMIEEADAESGAMVKTEWEADYVLEDDEVDDANRDEAEFDDEDALDSNELKALEAEIRYCIEEEMAVGAADFLVRRTGLLYFDRERAERIAIYVVDIMGKHLGWNEAEIMKQKLQLAKEWEAATVTIGRESD